MIYCDHQIEKAIRDRRLMIDPLPDPSQFDSTSLNLRVGDDFLIWKEALQAKGTAHSIDLDNIDLSEIIGLTDPLPANADGIVVIPPGAFVLVRTLEHLTFPLKSKAGRPRGRKKQTSPSGLDRPRPRSFMPGSAEGSPWKSSTMVRSS